MPMQLDPSIILNYEHDRNVTANRELAQRQRESEARIGLDQQEAELRRQEILARREEIIQRALERNQPKEWDPNRANQALTYQQNVAKAVYGQLKQVEANPDTWVIARRNIGQLLGPEALTDLPEDVNEAMPSIKMHIASYPAEAEKAQLQLVTHYDPETQTNVQEFVAPTAGTKFPQAAPKATGEAKPGTLEYYMTSTYGPNPTPEQQRQGRKEFNQSDDRPPVSVTLSGPLAATGGLDEGGLEYAATTKRLTGALPARDKTQNAAIINAAARQIKELGQTPVAALQKQAAYKGDAAALAQMQKMSASAEAFESKAIAQTDIIRDLSAKVPRTKWPIINGVLQAGRTEIAGDANATQLANAIETFSEEYAKIMNGATGSSAAASDSSRAAAKRLINTAMNAGTMDKVLTLMQREMSLTMQGYDAVKEHISTRMGGTPSTAAPTAVTPTLRFNPATGKAEAIK